MSNSLDWDQDRHTVGPRTDILSVQIWVQSLNCLDRLSADNTSGQREKKNPHLSSQAFLLRNLQSLNYVTSSLGITHVYLRVLWNSKQNLCRFPYNSLYWYCTVLVNCFLVDWLPFVCSIINIYKDVCGTDQEREGAQWLSGRVLDSPASLRCGPWARHIYPSLVLIQPWKTRPCLTEILLMGRKESNQTKNWSRETIQPSFSHQSCLFFLLS